MTNGSPKTLVVVRCGDASLHERWSDPEERLFDLAVSYSGHASGTPFGEATFRHYFHGGKWQAISDFFRCRPDLVARYDYFWFPDDDISASAGAVNRLFALGSEHGLDVFQPSLDTSSYYSHLITLHHPSFLLRHTNFVEIMQPVLSRRLLEASLDHFRRTLSGFGLDFRWPEIARRLRGDERGAAIVDAVTVRHTRPVENGIERLLSGYCDDRHSGKELFSAVRNVAAARSATINGQAVPRIRVLSGVKAEGAETIGLRLAPALALDLLARHANEVQPVAPYAAIKHALKAVAAV